MITSDPAKALPAPALSWRLVAVTLPYTFVVATTVVLGFGLGAALLEESLRWPVQLLSVLGVLAGCLHSRTAVREACGRSTADAIDLIRSGAGSRAQRIQAVNHLVAVDVRVAAPLILLSVGAANCVSALLLDLIGIG